MAEVQLRDTAIKLFGKTIPLYPPASCEDEKDHESKVRHETSTACSIDKEEGEKNCKAAKKPDKILPCPRCRSMDTKFCYFNNYNVNQPRHFCKKCQRYWTAGGAMRNVPVGSGRRKSKSAAASGYRHILISDSGVALGAEVFDSAAKPSSVLSFESAVSQQREHSNESTSATAASDSRAAAQTSTPNSNGSPWAYPPCIPSSFFPIPFYPVSSYWGCAVPWISPVATVDCSPTLGKRSRDEAVPESGERCAKEAAKSSIWAMMGVKSDKVVDRMSHALEASQLLLHANPAAMSRSIHFQESS